MFLIFQAASAALFATSTIVSPKCSAGVGPPSTQYTASSLPLKNPFEAADPQKPRAVCTNGVPGLSLTSTESRAPSYSAASARRCSTTPLQRYLGYVRVVERLADLPEYLPRGGIEVHGA